MADNNLSEFVSGVTLGELERTKGAKYAYNVRELKAAESELKKHQSTRATLERFFEETKKSYDQIDKVSLFNRIKNAGEIRRRKKFFNDQLERLKKSMRSCDLRIRAATADVEEYKSVVDTMEEDMRSKGIEPQEVYSEYNKKREILEAEQDKENLLNYTTRKIGELTQTEQEVLVDFQSEVEQPSETISNEFDDGSFDNGVNRIISKKEDEKNGFENDDEYNSDGKSSENHNYVK